MEGSVIRYGITGSKVEINVWKSKNEINKVTIILPKGRSIDITLEEARSLKEILKSCQEI